MNNWFSKGKKLLSHVIYSVILKCFRFPSYQDTTKTTYKRISVVCLAALGDFIVFCDVARQLSQQGFALTLICKQGIGIEEFAEQVKYFDTVIALPNEFQHRISNLKRLRSINCNIVLAAPVNRHILSDLYVLAMNAESRILPDTLQGCSLPALKQKVDLRVTKLVSVTAVNELERYKQYMQGSGLQIPTIHPYTMEQICLKRKLRDHTIAVFPGAGVSAKRWPTERFAWVLQELYQVYSCSVIIMGTTAERPIAEKLCREIQNIPQVMNNCGNTSIQDTISILQSCTLVLANDSGSAHLGIACDTATVVVGGCWEYGRFYPNSCLSEKHRFVGANPKDFYCAPCGISEPFCTKGEPTPCMLAINREAVLLAAKQCLDAAILEP